MKILIVDDEYYSVESIRQKIAQNFPEFTGIFVAYDAEEAYQILLAERIGIMICDIEMPGASGLDLLDRIRSEGQAPVCIFLTAYDRFEYVFRAMKLSSQDYLLKPVNDEELRSAVRKAMDVLRSREDEQLHSLQASYWQESRVYLLERFYRDVADGVLSSDPEILHAEFRRRNLPEQVWEERFFPLLIRVEWNEEYRSDSSLKEFALRSALQEYYYCSRETPCVIRLEKGEYLLLPREDEHQQEELVKKSGEPLAGFLNRFHASFGIYISDKACRLEETAGKIQELRETFRNEVLVSCRVFNLRDPHQHLRIGEEYEFPFEEWYQLLLERKSRVLMDSVDRALEFFARSEGASKAAIGQFYYHFLQMLFRGFAFNPDGLESFSQQLSRMGEDEPKNSLSGLKKWVHMVIPLYNHCATQADSQNSAVEKVREYIENHLAEDLNREALAKTVYLNPDYLSHQFKEVTGTSITTYIINARVARSKLLLGDPKVPIRDIAIACGFQNMSYFTKQFRAITGMTPRDFRKRLSSESCYSDAE